MFVKSIVIAVTAAATLFTVASAAACADSAAEISKLVPILSDPNVGTCTTDSGYNLLSPTGLPDAATTAKMCASSACTALIKSVIALNPSDCDISLGTVNINVGALTGSFNSDCAKLSTTAPPASTTASPSTTTAAPSTTDAPSTTTASPTVTTAAPTPADNAC